MSEQKCECGGEFRRNLGFAAQCQECGKFQNLAPAIQRNEKKSWNSESVNGSVYPKNLIKNERKVISLVATLFE
jgi:hypothetical protein